jgi:hypothetical protein
MRERTAVGRRDGEADLSATAAGAPNRQLAHYRVIGAEAVTKGVKVEPSVAATGFAVDAEAVTAFV